MEVSSGWYLRGNLDYNFNKSPYYMNFNGVDT